MAKGGKIAGAGRKTKYDEEKSKQLAMAAIVRQYGSVEKGLMALLESGEGSLIKFVFEHALGKPTENVDLTTAGESLNVVLKKVDGR